MRRLREFVQRFGGLFNKQRKDRGLEDEIESHLQLHIEDNLRSGMAPEEARREAMIKLGVYEGSLSGPAGLAVAGDSLAGRSLRCGQQRKTPGFTAIAVLTLALESYFVRTVRMQKVGECFSFSSLAVSLRLIRQSNTLLCSRPS